MPDKLVGDERPGQHAVRPRRPHGDAARGARPRAADIRASRVLGRLRDAGLVVSQPGPKGGWRLAADPATTTLADIWRAVHGEGGIIGLHEASPACTVGRRIQDSLADIDRSAARAIERDLAGTTLRDLARGTRADEFEPAPAA